LIQEKAGNTLEAISIGKFFLSRTPAAQQLRECMDKWDYIKFKSFCTTNKWFLNIRWLYIRQRTDNQNIQGAQKKLNSPQINEPIKKRATELNRTFSKEESKWPKNT
jgi:hypothetical protein